MERAKFFKNLLLAFMNFMIISIGGFTSINFVIVVTERLHFFTASFILQIVNILVLLF